MNFKGKHLYIIIQFLHTPLLTEFNFRKGRLSHHHRYLLYITMELRSFKLLHCQIIFHLLPLLFDTIAIPGSFPPKYLLWQKMVFSLYKSTTAPIPSFYKIQQKTSIHCTSWALWKWRAETIIWSTTVQVYGRASRSPL